MPPKTNEEWERAINKTVEAGKHRADWFEPSAEVILASTAKEQMLKLVAEKDQEREAAVKAERERIIYVTKNIKDAFMSPLTERRWLKCIQFTDQPTPADYKE